MHFFRLALAFVLPTLALASYNQTKADIDTISSLLDTLSSDAKNMKTGDAAVPLALQVQVDAVNLDKAIISSTANAKSSSNFGDDGSPQVGLALVGVQPKITTVLGDISSQSGTFGDLGIIVLATLNQLKGDTDAFAAAIKSKLATLQDAIAPGIVDSIDKAFNDAITAYNRSCEFYFDITQGVKMLTKRYSFGIDEIFLFLVEIVALSIELLSRFGLSVVNWAIRTIRFMMDLCIFLKASE